MNSILLSLIMGLSLSALGEVSVKFAPVDIEPEGINAWLEDINHLRVPHSSNLVELDQDTQKVIEVILFERSIKSKNYIVMQYKANKRPSRGIACVDDGFRDCSTATAVDNNQDGLAVVPGENADDSYYSVFPGTGFEPGSGVPVVDNPTAGDAVLISDGRGTSDAQAWYKCGIDQSSSGGDPSVCDVMYPNGSMAYTCHFGRGRPASCDTWLGDERKNETADDDPNDGGNRPVPRDESPTTADPNDGFEEQERNAGLKPPSAELYASCVARYRRAAPICGSDEIKVDGEKVEGFLKTKAGPTFMMLANVAGQLATVMGGQNSQGTTQGMLNACKKAQTIATGLTALNGAWAGGCALMRSQCRSSCEDYLEESRVYYDAGGTDLSFDDKARDARRISRQCREGGPMTQAVQQGVMGGFQSAVMLANSKLCVDQLSALGPCQGPDALTKPECVSFCAQPENSDSPVCQTQASVNCSDPNQARSNPICICRSNPSDPACSTLGSFPRADTSLPTGGSGSFPSTSPGGGVGVAGGGTFGRDSGPGGPGGPSARSRNGSGGPNRAGLGLSGGTGGPGGAGGAGSGGSFGGPGGSGGVAAAGSGFKTDIMKSARGSGLRSGRRGGNRVGRNGAVRYANQGPNGRAQAKRQFDLKAFLPGGKGYNQYQRKRSLAGMMTLKARDGITGPYGPSLFEKVSKRYRIKEGTMRP